MRFHQHEEGGIVVHLIVELYARSVDEATDVPEEAARGTLAITSLAEEKHSAHNLPPCVKARARVVAVGR